MAEGLGLKAYRERKEAEEKRREEAAKPKVNRFTLVKDGDSAVVRFAQEIDPDAKNYDVGRGHGLVHIEHNHPDPTVGWRNRGRCSTESQGACVPCERVQDRTVEWDDRKGWKQKEKFYINVIAGEAVEVDNPNARGKNKKAWLTTDLADDAKGGVVFLLEQGTYNGIYDALATFFLNVKASKETILGKTFQITRKGNNFNDTSYSIIPVEDLPKTATPLDDFELYDIDEVSAPEIEYAKQEAFYHKNLSVADDTPRGEPAMAGASTDSTSTTDSW